MRTVVFPQGVHTRRDQPAQPEPGVLSEPRPRRFASGYSRGKPFACALAPTPAIF